MEVHRRCGAHPGLAVGLLVITSISVMTSLRPTQCSAPEMGASLANCGRCGLRSLVEALTPTLSAPERKHTKLMGICYFKIFRLPADTTVYLSF